MLSVPDSRLQLGARFENSPFYEYHTRRYITRLQIDWPKEMFVVDFIYRVRIPSSGLDDQSVSQSTNQLNHQ